MGINDLPPGGKITRAFRGGRGDLHPMHMMTTNGLENPPDDRFGHGDRAAVHGAELGQIRRDLVAMTVLFRLLSYAVVVRSMESRLEAVVGEEEEDAGPSLPPMAADDWVAYS